MGKIRNFKFSPSVKEFLIFFGIVSLVCSNLSFAKDCKIVEKETIKNQFQKSTLSCQKPNQFSDFYKKISAIFSYSKAPKIESELGLDQFGDDLIELDEQEKKIIRAFKDLRRNFRVRSNIGKKIDSFMDRVSEGRPYQQQAYELLKSLYQLVSVKYAPASKKSIWQRLFKPADPLVTALETDIGNNPQGVEKASQKISNVINSFWIFINAKAPELFSCLSAQEKPIYEIQLNDIYSGLDNWTEEKFSDQILRDLKRDQERILYKEEGNKWSSLKEFMNRNSRISTNLKTNKHLSLNHRNIEQLQQGVKKNFFSQFDHEKIRENSWDDGALKFNKDKRNSEKAAYYQIHSLYQGIFAEVLNNINPMFMEGMGKDIGFPPKYLHWSTIDPSTGEVHRYAIMNVFAHSDERVSMLPTLIEMPIDCTTIKKCHQSTLTVRPLPFANREVEKKTLGISP